MRINTEIIESAQGKGLSDKPYMHLLENVSFQPIFIMGDHRSGTTLLYKTLVGTQCFNFVNAYHIIKYDEILSNHINKAENEVHQELEKLFNDLNINNRSFDQVTATPDSPEEYAFLLLNNGYKSYLNKKNMLFFTELCRKIQYVQDRDKPLLLKNPWDFSHYMDVKRAFPAARFIFIHRHPIHIINSKLKAVRLMLSTRGEYSALISKRYRKILDQPARRLIYQFLYSSYFNLGLNRVANTTVKSTAYYLNNIGLLSNKDYISITYEALCRTPETTIRKILDFLNLKEKMTLDYANLIKPRSLNLLPEVQKQYVEVSKKLDPYLTYHGY